MKKIAFIVLALIAFISSVKCEDNQPNIANDIRLGFGFLNKCKILKVNEEDTKTDTMQKGICLGYFLAIFQEKSEFSYELTQRATYLEIHKMFIKYLKNTPELLHFSTKHLLSDFLLKTNIENILKEADTNLKEILKNTKETDIQRKKLQEMEKKYNIK